MFNLISNILRLSRGVPRYMAKIAWIAPTDPLAHEVKLAPTDLLVPKVMFCTPKGNCEKKSIRTHRVACIHCIARTYNIARAHNITHALTLLAPAMPLVPTVLFAPVVCWPRCTSPAWERDKCSSSCILFFICSLLDAMAARLFDNFINWLPLKSLSREESLDTYGSDFFSIVLLTFILPSRNFNTS